MAYTEYITYRDWTIERHGDTYTVWVDDWYKEFDSIDEAYIFIDEMIDDK